MTYNHIVRHEQYRAGRSNETARESALAAVMHLLQDVPPLSLTHQRELLGIALWKWTEAAGVPPHSKYNLRFATRGALNHDVQAKINHEHVWPRKWMIDRLLDRKLGVNEAHVRKFLERVGVACVVTVDEHARLSAASGVGWQRYANAGVEVWDLLESRPLDLTRAVGVQAAEPQPVPEADVEPEPEPDEQDALGSAGATPARDWSVEEAFRRFAGQRAPLLTRLVETARREGGAALVGATKNPLKEVGGYVRIHDVLIEEPTRTIAWLHWNGKVSVGLSSDDLPGALRNDKHVKFQNHHIYGVCCKVNDLQSLRLAEQLVVLALDKIRESFWAVDV